MWATLTNLHPNECSQGPHHYLFAVNLDRCIGSCNSLNDLSNRAWVPNKTDLNLRIFNIIIGTNESKKLTIKNYSHGSCKCKCKFDGGKCN